MEFMSRMIRTFLLPTSAAYDEVDEAEVAEKAYPPTTPCQQKPALDHHRELQPSYHKWIVKHEGAPRRVNHAAVRVGDYIFSFGGFCAGKAWTPFVPIDVFILNTVTFIWTDMFRAFDRICHDYFDLVLLKKRYPFDRYGHSVVAYNRDVYLFGGRNDYWTCNTVFKFDTRTLSWSRVLTSGVIPEPRDGHSACVIGHRMYIFGGYRMIHSVLQELMELDLDTKIWSHLDAREAPACDFHSASAIGTRMYIFGGRSDEDHHLDHLVYYDTISSRWEEAQSSGDKPSARRSHSAFVYKNELYIFGGFDGIRHFNTMHCYNPETGVWRPVQTNVGRTGPPCPRRRHASIIVKDRLFVFGGTSPSFLNPITEAGNYRFDVNEEDGNQTALMEHNDLYVLDLQPSLYTLSYTAALKAGVDVASLPYLMRAHIPPSNPKPVGVPDEIFYRHRHFYW